MLHAHRAVVRREDSNAIESRLRDRDRDQVVVGNQPVVNPYAFMIASQEAAIPQVFEEEQAELLQEEQLVLADAGEQAPQDGGDDDLFAALGDALDEIEGEERAEAKEYMAPSQDRLEVVPALDTMYKSMTRSFICSTDPRLFRNPRTITRPGQLVTTVDKNLEELLTISLNRARHALEQRRAKDGIRTHRRVG